MHRHQRSGTSTKHKRSPRRLGFERLEPRLLLSSDLDRLSLLHLSGGHPGGCCCPCCGGGGLPAVQAGPATSATPGGAAPAVPLSSLPALNSLPGAKATLYLDFDGHFEAQWGAYSNVNTPAFDQDGDPGSFSAAELATIKQIWSNVAEDYAPFNINVTTVAPASFANGVALRVAIGGTGSWTGGNYGGIGYVDSFTNSIVNTAHVFSKNLGNGYAKYVADAASHEAGHSFGLQHQSQYSGTTKVTEYFTGPGDGRAPLLGNSYSAPRSLWWKGTTVAASVLQDDMAVIARPTNGFGYRLDDHGDTTGAATSLTVSGSQVSGAGIISTSTEVDYFSFVTGAGQVSLSVSALATGNNLDARLELRNSAGVVIASADPSISFGASVAATVSAGTYYLVVASHGSYGDVGKYTISGSVVAVSSSVAAPTNLTATATSTSQVNLTWQDNVSNETGYQIERSTNGTSWALVATTGANVASYQNTGLSAATTYFYRVRAVNAAGASGYSATVSARTGTASGASAAPSSLNAVAISGTQVNLTWQDNSNNETRFVIQRSENNGQNWTTVGRVWANVRSFSDVKVSLGRSYSYRVYTENASGDSPFSSVARATTPSASLALPGDASPASDPTLVDQVFIRLASRRHG